MPVELFSIQRSPPNLQWSLLDDVPGSNGRSHQDQNQDRYENGSGAVAASRVRLTEELLAVFAGKVRAAITDEVTVAVLLAETAVLTRADSW